VPLVRITTEMQEGHEHACAALASDPSSWTSHTVIVVDQSGSMRKTDVADGASRADSVWLTLALDLVAPMLERRQASATDVISIVGMGMRSIEPEANGLARLL
jgi:hypothetical protein